MLNPTEMLFPIHVTNSFITLFARTAFTCHVVAFLALTSSGYLFAFSFWRCTSFIVICVCMLSSCFLGDIQYILGFPFYLWTSIANICFNHCCIFCNIQNLYDSNYIRHSMEWFYPWWNLTLSTLCPLKYTCIYDLLSIPPLSIFFWNLPR